MSQNPLILYVVRPDVGRLRVEDLISDELRVTTECDVDEAIAGIAGLSTPNLVLLDGMLENRDIVRILESIREASGFRFLPVLAILPRPNAPRRRELFALGCEDCLEGPFEFSTVLEGRIRVLLQAQSVCDRMAGELARLTEIGLALSSVHELQRLLDLIVLEARAINHADAGSLYTVDREAGVLRFQIIQNESQGVRLSTRERGGLDLPPVPLTTSNVSAYVAITGETVSIPDVYKAGRFDFSGPRRYDRLTGYRSQSMLVVPMRNHEDEIIGVLQLINAQKPGTGEIVPFHGANVERTRALASQAGIALNNARLIVDLQELLEGLIRVMASAVDEKSAYTSGHIQRVTRLATLLAEAVNENTQGPLGDRHFTPEQIYELRIAGLLHDIGKIVVPEYVVDKATKLQAIYDRIGLVEARFASIQLSARNEALERKLALAGETAPPTTCEQVDAELAARLAEIRDDLEFIRESNQGGEFLPQDKVDRLHAIGRKTYRNAAGVEERYLTDEEMENLCIQRGTLRPQELEIIRSHVAVSYRLLTRIPFPERLRNVPTFAGDHHEMLNGSGYPLGKSAEELPIQSRMLAIADIYDALSATDRPYKKAFEPERCFSILRDEVSRGRLDGDLVELFIAANCPARLQAELAAEEAARAEAGAQGP